MKTIFTIFLNDIKGICKNIFALIIAGGLCIIPSLYAWFNIYSNWDPYANTGSVKIAVYSSDEGYIDSEGINNNMGATIMDNLRDNDKLGWTFTHSEDEAIDGVKKGDYYAAIIIGNNFSRSMIDFIENGMEAPSVIYYENAKKNAIASKITQSGMSSLQETINETFVDTVVTTILQNTRLDELSGNNILADISLKLNRLNNNLNGYDDTIAKFSLSNENLSKTLKETDTLVNQVQNDFSKEKLEAGKSAANAAIQQYVDNIFAAVNKLVSINSNLNTSIGILREEIQLFKNGDNSASKEDILNSLNELNTQMSSAVDESNKLVDSLKPILEEYKQEDIKNNNGKNQTLYDNLIQSLTLMPTLISTSQQGIKTFTEIYASSEADPLKLLDAIDNSLAQGQTALTGLNNILSTSVTNSISGAGTIFKASVSSIYNSLIDASDNLTNVSMIINGVDNTLDNVNITLNTLDSLLDNVILKLKEITEEINEIAESDNYELLEKLLDRDASLYGEFFASPVQVTTENIYDAINYGSAVSPFYTTLALWVGGLLLTALIKTSPEGRKDAKNASLHEMYFGRYLIFWLCGQIQAVITVLGDLFILKISCAHPILFMFTASIVSFTFTLLIYTLTLSFGDVGKALAVVLVVLQIAGSSGTFPIELLPSFFRNVYIYFPFPYGINAMRECISGFYKYDYFILMSQLMLFVAGSLLIGLAVRKPFMKLNHYMHHRMHDTGMM